MIRPQPRAPDAPSAIQIGDAVRFRAPKGVTRVGSVVRWRKDPRGGAQGWLDVKCTDGLERSCRPNAAERID